uniref:ubiquitin-protein ligase E3A-like n=1 Tax=Ciona intestinalis TaxID=7719 RepID=UPI0002B8E9E9|nr:ubiquitin-protein ligase E3A-like [Ciona intestinalis]|eukprot:XP_002128407.2 ubiquitin-protein ligase E3A-like [Ciona intestinalis]
MNSENANLSSSGATASGGIAMSKRGAMKLQIQLFYKQLTEGCGKQHCTNENCASNSSNKKLSCDEAAAQAILLAKNKVELCNDHRSKIARTDNLRSDMRIYNNGLRENAEETPATTLDIMSSTPFTMNHITPQTTASDSFEVVPQCENRPTPDSAYASDTLGAFSTSENEQTSTDVEKMDACDLDLLSADVGSPSSFICPSNLGGFNDAMLKELPNDMHVEEHSIPLPQSSSSKRGETSDLKWLGEQCLNSKLEQITVSVEQNGQTSGKVPTWYQYSPDYCTLWKYCTTKQASVESMCLPPLKQAISNVFSNSKLLNSFALKHEIKDSLLKSDLLAKQWESSPKMTVGSSDVFSPTELLSISDINNPDLGLEMFVKQTEDSKQEQPTSAACATNNLNSAAPKTIKTVPYMPTVDMTFFRTLFVHILEDEQLQEALNEAVSKLIHEVEKEVSRNPNQYKTDPNYLNLIVIMLECPLMQSPESLEEVFPTLLKIVAKLPLATQVALVHHWSMYDGNQLRNIIETIQQLIAYQVAMNYMDETDRAAHNDETIINASKALNILYFSSILGGEVDCTRDEQGAAASKLMRDAAPAGEDDFHIGVIDADNEFEFQWVSDLGKELKLVGLDSIEPLVPQTEFVNEALNDVIKIDKDYANYRISQQGTNKYSFLHYPFLLTTLSKTTYLFYDNRVRMYSERRRTLMSSLFSGSAINPFLKIQVRRAHIINDTLVQLEMATENLKNLRKQLYVEFDGEEGADEGGVSKEFFALMVEEIFNPANGTFILVEESQLFWFNPESFEGQMQYKLIGIILGLAIYNNCILDIKFPAFLYKKLLGRRAKFRDIKDIYPVVYRSLCDILSYSGNVEQDMMLTFRVEYSDIYGCPHTHDLKKEGNKIPVTNSNRQEYVDLYSDWLLNTSVEEQFNAFLGGFELVLSKSPLKYLFKPKEVELLLCGSEHYDFKELEDSADYDGGFTRDSQTVKDFWSVVHELSEEEQKTLLQFSTGSDRAPVGGLSKLKMILARNGPDSDRLPTAHTCFNVILLPDYKNKIKLRERLLKAIKYSKGFGML